VIARERPEMMPWPRRSGLTASGPSKSEAAPPAEMGQNRTEPKSVPLSLSAATKERRASGLTPSRSR